MKRESSPTECWTRTGAMSSAIVDRVVSRRTGRNGQFSATISSSAQEIRILDSIRGEQ
jgi:hypothetical protein